MSSDDLLLRIQTQTAALPGISQALPCEEFRDYLQLLEKWNRTYNLTSVRNMEEMVSLHILDSLSALPFLKGNHCLDVGTGAGLPGLVLAMANPGVQWTLLDSNQKKIRFVTQAIMELHISNAIAVCQRVEDFDNREPFSTIVTRALSSLKDIYQKTRHLLTPDTVLLAMKSVNVDAELAELKEEALSIKTHQLDIPGLKAGRKLIELKALPSLN